MENFDPNTEQQVWQRVFAQPKEQPREDLRSLELAAMEQAAAYRQLAGTLTGRAGELARELHRGQQRTLAVLRGMGVLSGRTGERGKTWETAKESARRQLEKCYHRARRAMMEYTARTMDGEFGMVFQKLAEREGRHCALIAELLGML